MRPRRLPAAAAAFAAAAALSSGARPVSAQGPAPRSAAPGAAAPRRALVDSLDAYAARAARDWRVPGLAVAVVDGDSIVLAKGYGVRRVGGAEPVDAHTRFAIGSTTKAMTAVALGMLVDEGKVRWDAPVVTYLPGFRLADPYATRALTVRDLLTHRAGLGNADLLWTDADLSYDEIARRMATFPPAYPFRSGFVYQNIMYAVAGDVVRAASGMPWETFLRTRLWAPLGMTETEPTLAAIAAGANVAAPHALVRDTVRVVPSRPVDAVKAAGSVWSSVGDMARWTRFVLDSARVGGRRLLSAASYREIFSPQNVAPAATYPANALSRPHFFLYGFGWFLQDYRGEPVAMHTGSVDGMSALIGLLPERRVGVYVLANLDHAELRHALMYRTFDAYLNTSLNTTRDTTAARPAASARDWSAELRALFARAHEKAAAAERQREQRRAAGVRPSLPLDRYAGAYADSTFGTVTVTARGGRLRLAYGPRRSGDLEPWDYDTFRARWTDPLEEPSLVVFQPDGAGGVASVRAFDVLFTRPAAPPSPTAP